tara:strand:+ start:94 stop:552 length:459 start_codon:yes stop_codon:yes gene_type:complete
MVDYVENIRIHDGRWEFSIIVRTNEEGLKRAGLRSSFLVEHYKETSEFLEVFDSETVTDTDTRYWLPFGVVDYNYFHSFTQGQVGRYHPLFIVKRRKHPKRVVSLFALHRLGTVKGGITFTNLHRDLTARSIRDARDNVETSKQAKLNSLWK